MTNSTRMPVLFFGHGSPMNALAKNRYTEAWRRMGAAVPPPKAILAISAHWYTRGTAVTAMSRPRTIHDFGGFPQALFDIEYSAPGDPSLAAQIQKLLKPIEVHLDQSWGLDHGTWSVLAHAFPQADIPVVQLSIDNTQTARFHYELAKKLAPLREENVLIVGCGNVVHNLGEMQWRENSPAYDWALRFNAKVRACLSSHDHEALIDYLNGDEDARMSVPTPEHYLPLLYVAAQQQTGESIFFPIDGIEHASISMLSLTLGLPLKN